MFCSSENTLYQIHKKNKSTNLHYFNHKIVLYSFRVYNKRRIFSFGQHLKTNEIYRVRFTF